MRPRARNDLRVAGFTLIEVMITVAIIAIIGSIALPNYIDYVTRTKLVEGKTSLADMRTRLEQYYLDNRSYPGTCIPPAGGAAPAGQIYLPASQKFFTYTCALGANTYTVTATGIAAQGVGGFVFTVDQTNTRQTTSVPAGWTTSTTCWVSRKSGDC